MVPPPKNSSCLFSREKKEVSKFPAMHKTGLKTSETKKSLKFVEEGETQKNSFQIELRNDLKWKRKLVRFGSLQKY